MDKGSIHQIKAFIKDRKSFSWLLWGASWSVNTARRASDIYDIVLEVLWEWRVFLLKRQPSDGELSTLLRRNQIGGFHEYVIAHWLGYFGRISFIPTSDSESAEHLKATFPKEIANAIMISDNSHKGLYSVLESGFIDCRRNQRGGGHRIDWQLDPTTGYRFARVFSHRRWVPDKFKRGNADMKGPWELTRCQHFAPLGVAWWATNDRKYSKLYAKTIMDFIDRNPPGIGVQWSCTMDVGLRVVGWLSGLSFFQSSPDLNYFWWRRFLKSMVQHARFIVANLEFGTIDNQIKTSNHIVANLLGLYWISIIFRGLDAGCVWRGIAETSLEREIQLQILPDGGSFESSVPYHRLVVEMFLSAYALSVQYDCPLSDAYRDRLLAALRWIRILRQPNGRLPQVGDADSGRAHIFTNYGNWDQENMDHLLVAGAKVLNCPELAEGIECVAKAEGLFFDVSAPAPYKLSVDQSISVLPDSGLAVLRSAKTYLLISNSIVGTGGFGNHKHNDQLAVEWVLGDQPVLVDGGSYIYTRDPEMRNHFRGTATHNTVMINDTEQNTLIPEHLFRLYQEGSCGFNDPVETNAAISIGGWHDAYARLDVPVVHTRDVSVKKSDGSVRITDQLDGGDEYHSRWHFLLHPGITALIVNGEVKLMQEDRQLARVVSQEGGPVWSIEDGWYSPCYGKRVATTAIVAEVTGVTRVVIDLIPD